MASRMRLLPRSMKLEKSSRTSDLLWRMRMAENAAKLISENLKYPDGTPVQCVIGCTTIGGGAEAARVAEQFSTQNVTATLSVTPCWCYGTETFDMDPNTIKAVWGFNGTERPGAVYLAAVLAAHAQRGLPAFSIYGHDVQEANDDTIPDDVAEKILRFARGAVAAGWMKNKAYVNIGAVTMGIAGSFCDAGVLQKYFGIRAEWVDEVEILRRISIGIYDHDEYEKALAWVRENCKEGFDKNLGKNLPPVITKSKIVPADKDWEFIVKMTLIIFNSTRFFAAVVHHQYSHRRKNDGSTEMIKRNDGISEDDICQNQCATLVRA